MYHSAPLVCSTLAQRCTATVILMPKFDPEDFLAAVERYRATATQVVPTMFVRLLRLPDYRRLNTISRRYAP
ncbi:MAG: AMP-binding protein [Novosphingobium sp.]